MSEQALTVTPGTGAMFDGIARRYDLLNRLMSLGMDQSWRRKTIDALDLHPGDRVLDLATGTGDLAIRLLKRQKNVAVIGLDPSIQMLTIGRDKCLAAPQGKDYFRPLKGDACELPFADNSFDGVCIGFGIRNFPDRNRALIEIARVTRPQGRIAILELSEPKSGWLAPFVRFHVHHIVPWLGAVVSGAKEYRYLQRSIAAFPPPEKFGECMENAGIQIESIRTLTFGACQLYIGVAGGPVESAEGLVESAGGV